MPATAADLARLAVFSGPAQRRAGDRWMGAIEAARALAEADLPPTSLRGEGPPPPRAWPGRDPAAAARLAAARAALAVRAAELSMPVENLLPPDAVRRLCWSPPPGAGGGAEPDGATSAVADALRERGARPWQVERGAALVAAALVAPAPPVG